MSSPPRSLPPRRRGFSSLALLSAGALLLSSAGAGVLAFSKDAGDALAQISRRPQGAFTHAPYKAFLGSRPGRDPHGRGGMWSASRRAAVEEHAANERLYAWVPGDPVVPEQHSLAVSPDPGGSLPWEGSVGGVNTGNGNKLTSLHLLDWKSRGGMAIDFTLYHNSQTNYSDELGHGWTWTYDVYINNLTANPVLHWGDGSSIPYGAPGGGSGGGGGGVFDPGGGGGGFGGGPNADEEDAFAGLYAMVGGAFQGTSTTYTAPAGVHDALVKNADGTWTATKKDGTQYLFNVAGYLKKVTDTNGNATVLTLNAQNYVTRITDATGRYLTVSVDANNRFTGVTDPMGRTWTFTRNANDDLTSVGWPSLGDGNAYADGFSYDANHHITLQADRRGKSWSYAYNLDGSLASVTDPLAHATTYGYGSSATNVTDALGYASIHNYAGGKLTSQVDASGFSVSFNAYDAQNNVTSLTDGRGKTSTRTFDAMGNVLASTDPRGKTTTFTYNALSEPLTVTDPLGHATVKTYDAAGNLLTVKNALNKTVVTNSYGPYGLLSSSTNALGASTTYTYNTNGNVSGSTDPTGVGVSVSYDALGRATSATDAAGTTATTTYDAWGRAVAKGHPNGTGGTASTGTAYLPTGQVLSTTDELGRSSTMAYDNAGKLASVTNPRGDVETYSYDAAGRRTSVTNGRGKTRTYVLDARGEVTSISLPDGTVESRAYDGTGHVTATTNGLGQTILYGFDDAGRQTLVDYPTGTDTTFAYDDANRRTGMTDATGTTTWSYDAADRPTVFSAPQGSQTSGYDDAGRRTSLTGTALARYWTYDAAGRVKTLANESTETTTYAYDGAGRLASTTLANGQVSTYGYDVLSRTVAVTHRASAGGTTISSETDVYNPVGNLLSKTVDGTTTTFGYDNADQLTAESKPGYSAGYAYDANGNRTSKTLNGVTQTYFVDDGDKLTAITQGGTTVKGYGYDAAGRTTSVTSSAGTTTLTYDFESRVKTIVGPGVSNSFTYNGLDTRTGKVDSSGTATYRRDGAGVTAPVLGDGAAVYTPGVSQRRAGATTYDLPDRLGSATRQTDAAKATTATRSYDAFGMILASTGAPKGPFGFAGSSGYQEDGDTGLKLLGHRYYDPSTGRFLTRDPITDGRNWYAYCSNNPLMNVDPSGLLTILGFEFTWQTVSAGLETAWDAYGEADDFGYGDDGSHDDQPGYEVSKHLFELAQACEYAIEFLEGVGYNPTLGGGRGGGVGRPGSGGGGRPEGPQCFAAGTLVVMADGTAKAIEDVRPGDRIESRPETGDEHGKLGVSTVESAFELRAPSTLLLSFADGASLEVTAVHPLYAVGRGFTAAGELRIGDRVAEAADGEGCRAGLHRTAGDAQASVQPDRRRDAHVLRARGRRRPLGPQRGLRRS